MRPVCAEKAQGEQPLPSQQQHDHSSMEPPLTLTPRANSVTMASRGARSASSTMTSVKSRSSSRGRRGQARPSASSAVGERCG